MSAADAGHARFRGRRQQLGDIMRLRTGLPHTFVPALFVLLFAGCATTQPATPAGATDPDKSPAPAAVPGTPEEDDKPLIIQALEKTPLSKDYAEPEHLILEDLSRRSQVNLAIDHRSYDFRTASTARQVSASTALKAVEAVCEANGWKWTRVGDHSLWLAPEARISEFEATSKTIREFFAAASARRSELVDWQAHVIDVVEKVIDVEQRADGTFL
jgi:hypothetical protein